jgi:hypothetical protein
MNDPVKQMEDIKEQHAFEIARAVVFLIAILGLVHAIARNYGQ